MNDASSAPTPDPATSTPPPMAATASATPAPAGPATPDPPAPNAAPSSDAPASGTSASGTSASGTSASGAPVTAPHEPGLLDRMPWWTVPAILVGVPLLFALVVQVVPAFYDEVVWKYYWGPIKADAENVARLTHDGVVAHSGYNVVNTLSWAVLLGTCILGLAQMLRHFRTEMDARLIVAATSWVVVGSVAHVLEDAGLFATPLQYLFITPPIYLLFGAFGVGAFLVGQWLRTVEARSGLPAALRMLWLVHVVLVLLWTGFWLKPWDQITHYVNPLWVAGFAVVSFFVARHFILRKGTIDATQLCLTLSLGTYLLVIAYVVSFIRDPWMEVSDGAMPSSSVVAPLLALLATLVVWKAPPKAILVFVAVVGALVGGLFVMVVASNLSTAVATRPVAHAAVFVAGAAGTLAWAWPRLMKAPRDEVAKAYRLPINLLIVFGQMVDAFATSIGIDRAGYVEKHVLSAAIIDEFRELSLAIGFDFGARYPTFLAFATVKLLVSLVVIYAIDVYSKDDARTHPTLIGLVKFAIIMVGLGPGVRDFVRLSLGI